MVIKERVEKKKSAPATGATEVPKVFERASEPPRKKFSIAWFLVGILAIALFGGFFYWLGAREKPSQEATATQPAAPAQQIGQQQPPQPQPAAAPVPAPLAGKKEVGVSSNNPVPVGKSKEIEPQYDSGRITIFGGPYQVTVLETISTGNGKSVIVATKITAIEKTSISNQSKLLLGKKIIDASIQSPTVLKPGESIILENFFYIPEGTDTSSLIFLWKHGDELRPFEIGPLLKEWTPEVKNNFWKITNQP